MLVQHCFSLFGHPNTLSIAMPANSTNTKISISPSISHAELILECMHDVTIVAKAAEDFFPPSKAIVRVRIYHTGSVVHGSGIFTADGRGLELVFLAGS